MPPKKKSKKQAANPARGFATTSTASKTKETRSLEEPKEVENTKPQTSDGVNQSLGSNNTSHKLSQTPATTKPLSSLTPEELEAELEDSALQLLVEENAARSNKDASRHTSRLHTERRLLRSSAEHLNLSLWIPDDILDAIIQQLSFEGNENHNQTSSEALSALSSLQVDDLAVKIWTLQKTLKTLGFPEGRVSHTIKDLVAGQFPVRGAAPLAGKESLWGLDESLEYLASTADRGELPDYDSHRTEILEKEKLRLLKEKQTSKLLKVSNVDEVSLLSPKDTTSSTTSNNSRIDTELDDSGSDLSSGEHDGDLEPSEMTEKYLTLQRKLFDREPELTALTAARNKKSKGKSNNHTPSDRHSTKLLERIQRLENDVLFDRDEAHQKWLELRVVLLSEAADRRKFLGKPRTPHVPKPPQSEEPTPLPSTLSEGPDEPDSNLDLTDFFSSLPDEPTASSLPMTTNSEDGTKITLRDFGGKWPGVNPRKVLEDACKARDPSCRVISRILSKSSFSNRHELQVEWSKIQETSPSCVLDGLVYESDDKILSVKMIDVACPDTQQSEAFVSTAALFLIVSEFSREDKAHLRLPGVWRDLWAEFVESRKNQVDKVDKEELKALKNLVESEREQREQTASDRFSQLEAATGSTLATSTTSQVADKQARNPLDSHEQLVQLWQSKTSTPSFQQMLLNRSKLPIWRWKEELIAAIEEHQAIVLCGETGCGKSTQVPSFILEHELAQGRSCKIYCTEPRRISAISLARRVSEELGERKNEVGTSKSLVGYAIRLESKVASSTRLVYATTGIVMRMLERGNDLEDVTHIILDEVHERTIDSDFLLIILRKLMVRRPNLKVVLMSATVNADRFSDYLGKAPIFTVPGRTFPVEIKYLEDVIELTNYGAHGYQSSKKHERDLDEDEDESDEFKQSTASSELGGYSINTRNVLAEFNEYRLDYELIVRLLETVAQDHGFADYSKAILVFMPGMAEIRRLTDMLTDHRTFSRGWEVFPLHSTIATEVQERAFLVPRSGMRKIVIATNIAETGITIPDVTCVIDTGKHKEMRFDERRQLSRLVESFISRANAKQRSGRAGRVQNGLCFRMFTQGRYGRLMAESQIPEMLRLSLQDLALRVKICKLGDIQQVLLEALDPPSSKNIRRAVDSLIAVRALTSSENLTPLGRQLAKLPLDVYLGKLILLSEVFHCLDAGLTIAAILSSKSPFQSPMNARAQADAARLAFKKGDSDLITFYNAYCSWKKVCSTAGVSEAQFCRKYFLSSQTLSNIEDLKGQLTSSLVDTGLLSLNSAERDALNRVRSYSRQRNFVQLPQDKTLNSTNELVVGSVIAWSFYPKLLIRDGKGYRNVANNQSVTVHPASVNKGSNPAPKFLSFYQIMQSSSKSYNAHETTSVQDFAVALVCGEADFKIYSGVLVIDGNRLRFAVTDWKMLLALKHFRVRIREIIMHAYQSPGKPLSPSQTWWLDIWQSIFDPKTSQ